MIVVDCEMGVLELLKVQDFVDVDWFVKPEYELREGEEDVRIYAPKWEEVDESECYDWMYMRGVGRQWKSDYMRWKRYYTMRNKVIICVGKRVIVKYRKL